MPLVEQKLCRSSLSPLSEVRVTQSIIFRAMLILVVIVLIHLNEYIDDVSKQQRRQ